MIVMFPAARIDLFTSVSGLQDCVISSDTSKSPINYHRMGVDQKAMNVSKAMSCLPPIWIDGWGWLVFLEMVDPIRITIFGTSATKLNWGNRSSKMNQNISVK